MLKAEGLSKAYGSLQAVAGISLAVGPGEIVGLLGPNGAGKSTTVAMLSGLVTPDAGRVTLDGAPLAGDADPAKAKIGLVPQDLALYDDLSARGNLELFGALNGLQGARLRAQVEAALQFVGLADRAGQSPSRFSGGMRRRLNIAAALVHDPQVLLLDEPTVGVDPQSRNAIFDNLEALRARGKGLLYTTHYMEEAERLCDRIIIVDHGRIVAEGTQQSLRAALPAADRAGGPWTFEGELDAAARDFLAARGVLARAATQAASLEDVFLHLTGRSLRDEA